MTGPNCQSGRDILLFFSRACQSALIREVETTPKPGLVDLHDTGSHRDMDVRSFRSSAAAIAPCLGKMALLGYEWQEPLPLLFSRIRPVGVEAERQMLLATGGVNTHKGAIFSMGILAAAAGWSLSHSHSLFAENVLDAAGILAGETMERELKQLADQIREKESAHIPLTHGERLFSVSGCAGIRKEAKNGFPSIRLVSLPVMREGRKAGHDCNRIQLQALLALMARVEDTNILARSDRATLEMVQQSSARLLKAGGAYREDGLSRLAEMNREFVRLNISPGGCADLLADTIFLTDLEAAQFPLFPVSDL